MHRRLSIGRAAIGLAFLLATAWPAAPSRAYSVGITGVSGKQGSTCNICHILGVAPVVHFEGPDQLAPGTLATFRFVVESQSPNQTFAGLNIAASAGQLDALPGEGERAIAEEITHIQPKANVDGVAAWNFTWRAPDVPGTYTLFGAGNSVNRNGSSNGDRAAATTYTVLVVSDGTPPPGSATPTPPPAGTQTVTPTVSLNPCVGDCNGDGEVTINEIVIGVNIALGTAPFGDCPRFDANWDEAVTITELLQAVNAALNGCPFL